jgi:hypothetical protein
MRDPGLIQTGVTGLLGEHFEAHRPRKPPIYGRPNDDRQRYLDKAVPICFSSSHEWRPAGQGTTEGKRREGPWTASHIFDARSPPTEARNPCVCGHFASALVPACRATPCPHGAGRGEPVTPVWMRRGPCLQPRRHWASAMLPHACPAVGFRSMECPTFTRPGREGVKNDRLVSRRRAVAVRAWRAQTGDRSSPAPITSRSGCSRTRTSLKLADDGILRVTGSGRGDVAAERP